MPQHIVVVGGGVGGTIVANIVARALDHQTAEVTLIDSTGQHVYMPGWLYLPFNADDARGLSHQEQSLLNRHVNLMVGEVTSIDAANQVLTVVCKGGDAVVPDTVPYDYLVLGTGARLAPEDLPGLTGEDAADWHDFYSLEGALRLRQALHAFQGGRIVLAIGGIPYRCPPAPLEFMFLLDDWLGDRGLRSKTELQYLYPLNRVFPIESVAEVATPLLDQRGIKYTTFFNADSVDGAHKIIRSLEGDDVAYDLLVMIPPHRGARVIEESALGDEQGWIPTHRDTLEVKERPHIFALGDATDLPVSKSGAAAHFEAKVIAQRLIAAVRGEVPDPKNAMYGGDVMCFLETGHGHATQLVFDYEHPPRPPRPSRFYHAEKQLLNWSYYHLVPSGYV